MRTHYIKEVSSRLVMLESSAHSERMKLNVMVNECDRIMRNCSTYLEWNSEILPHLTYFMQRLKYCGYSIDFRHKVLSKAMKLYDLRMQNLLEGKSYYVLKDNSAKISQETRHDWYKEGEKYESVLFVEATPHSEYKSKVEFLVKKNDRKI